ncbi:MAG TPA: transaldolase [Bacteroidota bacterium]|nr:transaldolase [Bacteroidota bacterium]
MKLFADGANVKRMVEMYANPIIAGFTTNPTLMRKAGVSDYEGFAREVLSTVKEKPVSFEVFSDDFGEMEAQALKIASWGENVYVKIPVTNTRQESSVRLIERLSKAGIKLNVTAMLTAGQVSEVLPALARGPASFVSIFAGRIADSGIDPVPIMKEALAMLKSQPKTELIWASPRELYNVVQASQIGCHIITATDDVLKKLPLLGKDLLTFSLDTVKMFYDDAKAAGYNIKV